MNLRPFRALRYDTTRVNLNDVVAPPYDVIDDPYRDRLYERSPHNVVRLILNREADRYAASAQTLRDWLSAGLLRQDDEPALWLYVQDFSHGGQSFERIGVIGAMRLEPFSAGRIRPHERTLSGPKEDRMRLLRACRVNLSPIFGLYADQRGLLEEARAAMEHRSPLLHLTDDFGVRHRSWPLTAKPQIGAISSALGSETIYIADGHHRYETALAFRDHLRARGGLSEEDPANFMMAYLCSMDDPGLLVLPTHRILRGLVDFDPTKFVKALGRDFEVRTFSSSPAGRKQLLAALAAGRARGHFGITLRGVDLLYEISPLGEDVIDRAAPELPPVVRRLDVTILDRVILRDVLGLDPDAAARAGQLRYSHEDGDAFGSVDSGAAQAAFLLGPPDLDQVRAVCLSGETMPQKSTYFHPKLLTGLVLHPLSDDLASITPGVGGAAT